MIKLNQEVVTLGKFPNKESYLSISNLSVRGANTLQWMYEHDGEFFELALIKGYLDSVNAHCCLHILYMPYSRMDRVNGTYAVSCPIAAKLIKDMNFYSIVLREPHSQVCVDEVKPNLSYNWTENVEYWVRSHYGWDSLFFPDYGAKFRYKGDCPSVAHGKKERDFKTGDIQSYSMIGKVGERVLIVDDICSRGGTFIEAAKLLREKGAKSVGLLVAMCEENVHTGKIFDYVDQLYTSKDCILTSHSRITFI